MVQAPERTGSAPLAGDFRALAQLRRLARRGDPRTLPDYGRASVRAWFERFLPAEDPGVAVAGGDGPDAPLHLTPPEPATGRRLVYIHGGGLVYHDLAPFRAVLTGLAHAAGIAVTALDYPKAPETPVGQILDHLGRVLEATAAGTCDEVVLAGDSVGARLALEAADRSLVPDVAELQLIYPVVSPSVRGDAYGQGYFLDADLMAWFQELLDPLDAAAGGDPLSWPDDRLRALPPAVLHVAECDLLATEGRAFAERLQAVGRLRDLVEHRGLPHDFCLYAGGLESAAQGLAAVAASIADAARRSPERGA